MEGDTEEESLDVTCITLHSPSLASQLTWYSKQPLLFLSIFVLYGEHIDHVDMIECSLIQGYLAKFPPTSRQLNMLHVPLELPNFTLHDCNDTHEKQLTYISINPYNNIYAFISSL